MRGGRAIAAAHAARNAKNVEPKFKRKRNTTDQRGNQSPRSMKLDELEREVSELELDGLAQDDNQLETL